jgi:drug/metabolite transporter (DMT)-like permease
LFVAFDRADHDSGMWPLAIARFASVPMLLCLALFTGQRVQAHRSSMHLAVVAGVFDMGANGLYLVAIRGGLLSVVAVVASLYPASTVVLAATIDEERIGRWQAVGMVLAALALVMVTLSRQ